MRQFRQPPGQPRDARTSASKELVRRDVDAVDGRFLQVDYRMRRVLHGIDDNEKIRPCARTLHDAAISSFAPEMFDAYITLRSTVSASISDTIASTSTPPSGIARRDAQLFSGRSQYSFMASNDDGCSSIVVTIRAGHILHHGAHHLEHRGRRCQRRIDTATSRIEMRRISSSPRA